MSVLLGCGSHGHDIQAIYERVHGCELTMYDHDHTRGPVPTSDVYNTPCYIGINHSGERARCAREYVLYGAPPLIDPSSEVGPDCHLAPGVVIGPYSVLLTDVHLGRHTHINYACSMTRCSIGEFSTVAPGVTLCGDIVIGKECFIGAGAIICNLVNIGDRVTVGAGAVVLPNTTIPHDTTVVGVVK